MLTRAWLSLKLLWGVVRVALNPRDLDGVIALVEDLNRHPETIHEITVAFREAAPEAYLTKPRVNAIDLEALAACPPGSLGRAFAELIIRDQIDPADLPSLTADTDDEYTIAALYETHDLWHVVTGLPTDIPGELALQAFSLAQFPSRLSVLLLIAGLLNTVAFSWEDRMERMDAIVRGWHLGRSAKLLFGQDWASMWDRPLADIRRELDLVQPTPVPRALPALA